jgi:hypothetical protein
MSTSSVGVDVEGGRGGQICRHAVERLQLISGKNRVRIREQRRLVRAATALENTDDGPLATAQKDSTADFQTRETTRRRLADDELMNRRCKAAPCDELDLRPQLEPSSADTTKRDVCVESIGLSRNRRNDQNFGGRDGFAG